ncbi:MAG: HAD family hydrolase [Lactovum sp.]
MYQIAFIDLDGTLLDKEQKISKRNILAIHQAFNKGKKIYINSGRSPEDVRQLLKKYQLSVPFIASNGAWIEDETGFTSSFLGEENCLKIKEIAQKLNLSIVWNTSEKNYFDLNGLSLNKEKQKKLEIILEKGKAEVLELAKSKKSLILNASLINLSGKENSSFVKELNQIEEVEALSTSTVTIDCNLKGINKGTAISLLLKRLNISKENALAIGDHENDLAMFDNVSFKIAMGNALDILKEKADEITQTNDEDAVALSLEKYL